MALPHNSSPLGKHVEIMERKPEMAQHREETRYRI